MSTRFAGDAVNYVAGFTSGRGIHYDFFVGDGALHCISRNHIRTGYAENIRAFLNAWCLPGRAGRGVRHPRLDQLVPEVVRAPVRDQGWRREHLLEVGGITHHDFVMFSKYFRNGREPWVVHHGENNSRVIG